MSKFIPFILLLVISIGLAEKTDYIADITALQAPLPNSQLSIPQFIQKTNANFLDDTTWTAIAKPSNTPDRLTHATVYDPVEDKIYMIGGTPSGMTGSQVNFCQQYDPETNTWTDKSTMPTAKGWIKGDYVRGKIYCIGGLNLSGSATNENVEYTIAANAWVTKAARPRAAVASLDVVWRDSLIYVMGGWNGVSGSPGYTEVDIYNPFTNTWSTGTALPQNIDMGDAVIIDDTIYITNAVNRISSSCWSNLYKGAINPTNPTQITWIQGPAFSSPTSITGAAALNGNVFWLGGFVNLTSVTNQAWVYNRTTGTINNFVSYPVTLARCCFMTARTSGASELYVIAGDSGGNWYQPNQVYRKCVLEVPRAHDVGVRSITSPVGRIPSGSPVNVQGIIKNYGTNDETFPAHALINDGTNTIFEKETTLTITASQELNVVFGQFTPNPNMTYYDVFSTALVGDEYAANDTLRNDASTFPDAGVLRIVSPTGRIIPATLTDAKAVVMNYSAEPKDVPATMRVVDTVSGDIIIDKDTTLAMGAAESLAVVFGQFTSVIRSFYEVVAYTTLAGDDDPSNDTAYATAVCRYGSAPDPFGYYYESTQEPGDTVTYSWIDPTGGTILTGWTGGTDDGYLSRTLPFGINFYRGGAPNISQINVCTNGFLETSTMTTWTNTALPASSIQNLIAPFWDDLTLASGSVIEKSGTDGSYVAYTWVGVPQLTGGALETFQVVLYRNNHIRFNYQDVNGTLNSNTVGIQGGTGVNGWFQQYVFDGTPANHILADNVTIAFTCDSLIGIAEMPRNDVPNATILHTAKPNPVLKGTAQIAFSLAKKGDISLNIYDATGRMVRNLINSSYDAGSYTITWDGKNDKGAEVMSGIYFYTIETSNYKSTRKLVFMR